MLFDSKTHHLPTAFPLPPYSHADTHMHSHSASPSRPSPGPGAGPRPAAPTTRRPLGSAGPKLRVCDGWGAVAGPWPPPPPNRVPRRGHLSLG